MPPWHHHCGCPYHRRGQPCPICDERGYWPRTREEWEEPQRAEVEPVAQRPNDLRDAIERLNERIDALEVD